MSERSDKNKGVVISVGSGDKKKVVSGSGPTIKVQGKPIQQKTSRGVDLVFVIDTTGSMSDKIDGLLATCAKFVEEFAALNLDHRVAIVAFGDLTVPGDKVVAMDFTSKVEAIKQSLQKIPRYSGGGNQGESSLEAMDKALALPFGPNVVKVVILITDEPALQSNLRASDMANKLSQKEFLAFVIPPPYDYFKEMANKNGGKWYQVAADTDLTDLLEMFKQIAKKVSQVVSDVYQMGDGSVANYLKLKPPEK